MLKNGKEEKEKRQLKNKNLIEVKLLGLYFL